MQLGSNDLTDSDPLHVGSAIDDFVRLLHDAYGVKGCLHLPDHNTPGRSSGILLPDIYVNSFYMAPHLVFSGVGLFITIMGA